MAEPGDFTDLDSTRWERLDALASKLEDAWKLGGPVDLNKIVPAAGDPLRIPAINELVKVDMECRWRRGQSVSLDYYLDKFPEIGPRAELAPTLIVEEYRVRHLFGDKPPLKIYEQRFPRQFAAMQKLLAEQPLPTLHVEPQTAKDDQSPPAKPRSLKDNQLQLFGGCKMLERLGAGSFGEVWKAEVPGGFHKAIKVIFQPIDTEEAQLELKSLELIKAMRHHFLLATHAFSPFEDRLYILMDLADGSLGDRLKKSVKEGNQGIPLIELIKYVHEAAEALDYLHEKGVQHRDIKPENILLSDGNVRVADFGLARHQKTRRLVSGSGMGTPVYMPPETWRDKVHNNSDQYSLAATYFECRTNRRIFETPGGLPALMEAHLNKKPKLDPLSVAEQKVLARALSKNPDHRYPSCVAFAEDLERAVVKELPPGTLRLTSDSFPAYRDAKPRSAGERVFLLAGLASIFILAAVIWIVFRGRAGPGAIEFDSAEEVAVAGEQTKIPIRFNRNRNKESLTLTYVGNDPDLEVASATEVGPDESAAQVTVSVKSAAALGKRTLPFTATTGSGEIEVKVGLEVRTLTTLPKPCAAGVYRPVANARIRSIHGRKYYEQIEIRSTRVPALIVNFLLIPWDETDKQPFYMMENKAWNDLFAQFADEEPGAVNGSRWRLGARGKLFVLDDQPLYPLLPMLGLFATSPTSFPAGPLSALNEPQQNAAFESRGWPQPNDFGVLKERGSWPVLRAEISEAHRFAEWMGGLLPTVDQWDKAAGRLEKDAGEGPFQTPFKKDEIAVNREYLGPLPVGVAVKDRSVFGCRDMAGNGLEWTRTVKDNVEMKEYRGDAGKFADDARILLRGRDFHVPEPLRFVNEPLTIEYHYQHRPFALESQIGFRVVVVP